VDNLLTPEALTALRRFCQASTIWNKSFDAGYLGTTPESGFACPLLAQIAEEFPRALPEVFRAYPLKYLWAFKYDSRLAGINIHADFAAVNVNFWITPYEANLDPAGGAWWCGTRPRPWTGTSTLTIPTKAQSAAFSSRRAQNPSPFPTAPTGR